MAKTREEIMEDVLKLLRELAEDWEYTGKITAETRLFTDMGLASLDVVVLGTMIQEQYGRVIPFQEFYAQVGQSGTQDIPIGDWVDFIHQYLNETAVQTVEGKATS